MTRAIRYSVTAPLDHGSRGFRGTAVSSDGITRQVAITPVRANPIKNERHAAMLLADLRASLRLKHANVVDVVDICRTPGRAYFVVSEYVEGCTLRAFVARRSRMTIEHAIHVVIECCNALAHAHSLGVSHRDIRPSTVMLSTTGGVKVTDFGLAKANAQIAGPRDREGQFSYLSPEAANRHEVDHRADIFAAGIVLWELLAHRRLFLGETDYETVVLVQEARFAPIDGIDPVLTAIARTALARNVSERYQSASELAGALATYAAAHRVNVSASDSASRVRDACFEIMKEQSRYPMAPQELARVQADVDRMISIATDDDHHDHD
jgi:serine/threonine protein kinase